MEGLNHGHTDLFIVFLQATLEYLKNTEEDNLFMVRKIECILRSQQYREYELQIPWKNF